MKTFIKTDIKRAFFNFRFVVSFILLFLVWEINSKRFTVYDDALYLFIHIWGRSTTSLLSMAITSFAYAGSYTEDVEGNILKYIIMRIGIKKYIISKILACFFDAFFVFVIGTSLFLIKTCLRVPLVAIESLTVANFKMESCLGWLLPENTDIYILIQAFLYGLYCAGMSVIALALSTMVKNSYAIYALPFLIHFVLFYIFSRISVEVPILSVERIFDSSTVTYTKNPVFLIGYAIFVTGIFIIAGYELMYKRLKGEFS